jgi:hypothetical protein
MAAVPGGRFVARHAGWDFLGARKKRAMELRLVPASDGGPPDLVVIAGPAARRYRWIDRGFLKLDAATVIPGFAVGLVLLGDPVGTVQAIAGPPGLARSPHATILPGRPTGDVVDGGFKPRVTDVGRRHPVTAGLGPADPAVDPAWGRWFRQMEVASADGAGVMEGNASRPLLILSRVGEGRVAQLTSDQIWLWSRGIEGGGPQAELLRRLAHWLMKEPELEENDLRARVEGNRITVERRSLEPDRRPLQMTAPSGRTEQIDLGEGTDGVARAEILAGEPGIYRFGDGTRSAVAVVGAVNPPELADMRATPARLQPVVDRTGGGVIWLAERPEVDVRRTRPDRNQAGRDWIGLRANGDFIVTGVSETSLLPAAAALFLALGTLLLAWRREGR